MYGRARRGGLPATLQFCVPVRAARGSHVQVDHDPVAARMMACDFRSSSEVCRDRKNWKRTVLYLTALAFSHLCSHHAHTHTSIAERNTPAKKLFSRCGRCVRENHCSGTRNTYLISAPHWRYRSLKFQVCIRPSLVSAFWKIWWTSATKTRRLACP